MPPELDIYEITAQVFGGGTRQYRIETLGDDVVLKRYFTGVTDKGDVIHSWHRIGIFPTVDRALVQLERDRRTA